MKLSVFQFVAVAPYPVAGHLQKESGALFLTPTLKILICIDKIPSQSSLHHAKPAQLS